MHQDADKWWALGTEKPGDERRDRSDLCVVDLDLQHLAASGVT